MDEEHFTEAHCSELYAFDDEDLPKTAFPLSYAFLGKAQSTDLAILKERAKTKSHEENHCTRNQSGIPKFRNSF
jgi:hypothetical protein